VSADLLMTEVAARAPAQRCGGRFWVPAGRRAWLVAEGGVDLFLQRRDAAGEAAGALEHVMRVGAGQAFFGAGADGLPGGRALLAVPLPGTALHVLEGAMLSELPAVPMIAVIEDWVSAITRRMPKPAVPRQFELLGTEAVVEAAEGQVLRCDDRVAWIEAVSGNALWLARFDCVANAAGGPLPLLRDLWITAGGKLLVRTVGAGDLMADGRIWPALEQHQRFVLRQIIDAGEIAIAGELARLQAKAQQSMILTQEALHRLLSVATDAPTAAVPAAGRSGCFEACRAIGADAGIDFRMPHASELAAMDRDPVAAIALASRVRYRRVALKGAWWTGDNGPLIATFGDEAAWVALRVRAGGYDLVDPATGRTVRVTAAIAMQLSPFATMFYRSLPDHPLHLSDILAFALRGRRADVGLILLLGVLGGLVGIATPVATGALVDTIIPSADVDAVWQVVGALVAAAVAASLFELARALAVLRVESKMDSSLQAALWDRVLKLPVPFFRTYSAGDLALRINGVNTIRRSLSRTTVGALLTGVFSIFNFFLLFYYSPALALVASVLVAIAIAVVLAVGMVKLRYERQLSEVGGKLSSMVYQYLGGIAKLRVVSAESRAFANWSTLFSNYRGLRFRAEHWENVGETFLTGYATLAVAVLFASVGMLVAASPGGHLSTGEFIGFSAAFGSFFAGLVGLANASLGIINLVPVYERARPILESTPETDEGKAHPGELQGGLEVANVSFRYGDGPDILKGVSFSVRPGGYIALVGPSGSGKSTLLRLLLGFEKATEGSIYYDSQDLAKIDIQALRRQIGVVLQNGRLIPGDIFTNIVGTSTLTIDDAWEAARMVGLDADIEQMPMGMHTVVGEGVSTLSGGQRQRILIARAIVHRPRILFFDEATSALDNRTQAIVTRSLEQLKVTRIVIAHRLSTIINADRIVVIEGGRVAQIGNYEKLMAEPGLFAELAKRQIA
jgi:ATP-binding cassette subfamily C protein